MSVIEPRFWERPVEPTAPVDLTKIPIYRRRQFPADGGPTPWLDRPDAEPEIDRRLGAGEITAEEATLCRQWARDGYVILQGFYDAARLDASWAAYERGVAQGVVTAPEDPFYDGDPLPGRVANAHFAIPALDEMLFEPRMGRLVSVLLGAAAEPFQTIIGHKSSRQLEHSDSIHMSTYPQGYLVANWIAYEDVDQASGPLVYYPGSHKLPYVLSEDLGIPAAGDYGPYEALYEPAIQAVIAERGLTPSYFLPKKGDVLLWHANLLHGGSAVQDPRLTRKALVCHFFAQGCVCYHDLPGSLAYNQLGLDLYTYKRGKRLGRGVLGKLRAHYRTKGVAGLVRKALGRS